MHPLFEHLATLPPPTVYGSLAGILLLCGLGLPIPEDISLIAAGWLAHRHVVSVHTVFVVCLGAVLGGDILAYSVGAIFGSRVLESRLFRKLFSPRKQLRVRAYFRKYGSKVIFVGRFLPGLRFSIFFSSGTLGVRFTTFILYDALAAAISVPTFVYLAYYFGKHVDSVMSWARRSEWGLLFIVGALVLILLTKRYFTRGKRKVGNAPAPTSPDPEIPVPPPVRSTPAREKSVP